MLKFISNGEQNKVSKKTRFFKNDHQVFLIGVQAAIIIS